MGAVRKSLAVAIVGVALAATAVVAHGAMLKHGDLVLHADGGFAPRALPRHHYAAIHFEGHADLKRVGGGLPPALQEVVLDFDRDGLLTTRGLSTCPPGRIADASPARARRVCGKAIVGRGEVAGVIESSEGAVKGSSPLTVFNGPRQNGRPTVLLHAQSTGLTTHTYVLVVPIERLHGEFRYRVRIEIPAVPGGFIVITHADVKIGRLYVSAGRRLSYTSARCSRYLLQTRGRFTFADGTVFEGTVLKPCTVRSRAGRRPSGP